MPLSVNLNVVLDNIINTLVFSLKLIFRKFQKIVLRLLEYEDCMRVNIELFGLFYRA